MSRYLKAHCNKCGEDFKFEIGEKTADEAKAMLESQKMFTCPGRHVEISGPMDYVAVDFTNVVVGDPPMTDEEFGASLIKEVGKENLFYMGSEEVGRKLGIPSLHSVSGLRHIGFGEFENDKTSFARRDSPGGFRFYVALSRG